VNNVPESALEAAVNGMLKVYQSYPVYTTNLGGAQQRTVMADAGIRWSW
jgi:hypothetical protein